MASKIYFRTSLIGGMSGDLDGIDGAIVVTSEWSYVYSLAVDSAVSESSPQIIKPDLNPGDKRWILSKQVEYIPTLDQRQVFIQSGQPTNVESEVGDLWIDIT